jgi:hypothetical protein
MAIEVENKGVWAFDETSIEDDDEDLAASVMAYQAALADQAATKQGDLGGSSSNQRVRANPPPPQAQPETLPPFHFTILKVYSTCSCGPWTAVVFDRTIQPGTGNESTTVTSLLNGKRKFSCRRLGPSGAGRS